MNTFKPNAFSTLSNAYVENILNPLVREYPVTQIFHHREHKNNRSHLFICLEKKADAEQLRGSSWVRKVRDHYPLHVYFTDASRMEYRLSKGHPFFEYHCQQCFTLYQSDDSNSLFTINRGWKKYRKKFKLYEDQFHHDHELQGVQIQRLISEDSFNSVFTSYEEQMKYDLEYLEELYTGEYTRDISIDQRIKILLEYIPELDLYFVKKNQKGYFVSELFAKAKEAIEGDDVIYDTEMFESLRIAEEALFKLTENRLSGLKKLIKKQYAQRSSVDTTPMQATENPKNEILDSAIEKILTFVPLEQIYLFHQTTYGETTTYYLLLIGPNAGNEKLKTISQSLKSTFGGNYEFLLISHDRYRIQKNLYQNQHFFAFIMQAKHLVYSSHPYHPEPHWEVPHQPYHNDLYFHYKVTLESAEQFYKMTAGEGANYQGVSNIFSLFFLSFCRTYLFVKTYYLPNYLTSEALWQLCIYADKDIYQYQYLIDQFFTDLFPFLDYHRNVHHGLARIDQDGVAQMKIIVEKLMNEVRDTVVGGGLLTEHQNGLIEERDGNG